MLARKFVVLTALLLLLGLYFWGHNSGTSNQLLRASILSSATMIAHLIPVMLLVVCAGSIGRRALMSIDFTVLALGERLAIESMIGLGIISLLSATLGLIGQYNWLIWGVILGMSGLCLRQVGSVLMDWRQLLLRLPTLKTPWERFVAGIVILSLVAALLIALAPPFAWDAINYHLVIPQRYLADGAIGQHLDNHFFGFPQNMEMLYGLLMMLGSDHAPAILHWVVGSIGLMALYHFVRRHTSRKAASVAVLLLVMSFNLWQLFAWAYVDLALLTYTILAVIAIQQWVMIDADQRRHWLILAGLLASLAAGVKYTAAPLLLGLYAVIIWRNPKGLFVNTAIFAGFGILLFMPWLVKGFSLYENPIYPYVWDGINWDSVRDVNFSETGKGFLDGDLWWHLPLLPVTATLFGVDKAEPYRFNLSPFLLTLPLIMPLIWQFLGDETKKMSQTVLVMAISAWLFWMFIAAFSGIGRQTRLAIVILPLGAILSGIVYHGITQWQRRPLDLVFILQGAMLLTVFFASFESLHYVVTTQAFAYHTQVIDERAYLHADETVGALYDAMQALDELETGSRVLFLWEPKTYYCPHHMTCVGDLLFDNWSRPLQAGITPDNLITQWRDSYDYVLLFDVHGRHPLTGAQVHDGYSLWSGLHPFAMDENAIFPTWFYSIVDVAWSDGFAYTIYHWRD